MADTRALGRLGCLCGGVTAAVMLMAVVVTFDRADERRVVDLVPAANVAIRR